MITIIILTLNYDVFLSFVYFTNLLSVADYRKAKVLGDLRTYLSGIAIDSLTASND